MGCDKRYGLREVWVAPEASPNAPATYAATNYLFHCVGSNFPAVYNEVLDNAEATGSRGQSMPFKGAQNELSWDVTVMMPSALKYPSSWPESFQSLFWAAGFGGDAGPSSWVPGASGTVVMAVKAGSACGRTIQLLGLDRDKRQLELLTGCVVSQVVFTFNRNDVCTIQFSGVAAQKYEATAPSIAVADLGNLSHDAITVASFDGSLPSSPAVLTGVSLTLPGASAELQSINGIIGSGSITLKTDLSASTITATTQSYWNAPKNPGLAYAVLGPDVWSLSGGLDAVQSATVTMETGQTYGELTTQAPYPTEILSGQVKVTASMTAYLVDANMATAFRNSDQVKICMLPSGLDTLGALYIAAARLTEAPAIDLSSVDTPASGDFNLQAGEAYTFEAQGFLDTLYTN